jgi:replicative DNA helicase Mcm
MNANGCILACCNPKNGVFLDMSGYESVGKQVNIPEPILSRFDLIFMLRDKINKETDTNVIRAVLGKKREQEIDTELFKKYISVASKLEPKMSEEVMNNIEEIYLGMRAKNSKAKETRITPRIATGLIRLAIASAKLRLSKEVELEDLNIAEQLIMDSHESMGFGRSLDSFDQASISSGVTRKKIDLRIRVKSLIEKEIKNNEKNNLRSSWKEIKPKILEFGFDAIEVEKSYQMLKEEGTLMGEDYRLKWYDGI